MLHACFPSNAYMFSTCVHMFSFVFRMFSCTNLLTRCHRLVAVFYCFLYFRKSLKEIFLEWSEIPQRSVFTRNEDRVRRRPGGGPGRRQRSTRRGPTLGHTWWALATASRRLFAYKMPLTVKMSGTKLFSTKHTKRHRHLESPI